MPDSTDNATRVTPSPGTTPDSAIHTPNADDPSSDDTQIKPPTAIWFTPSGMPVVPGYAVSREIARGGMGVVYRAHDPAFEREVAIKVMHPGQDAERFVVESKVTAQLPHPGVPPVYALGTLPDGRPFLAMKLIEGRTLADELKAASRADLPRLLGVFEQICQTVGFAHSRGIIHRDLKPANVMVGAFGETLVMDWGLARSVDSEGTQGLAATGRGASARDETQAGQVKGTPAYMAPEQARGEPVGARADVFALGGILAVMLTGKPPFAGDTVMDTIRKAARAELADCFGKLGECIADAELVAVAKRCLAADAADRYADGEGVAAAVSAYRASVEERLRQAERDRAASAAEAREQRKRRKVQLVLAGAVLLLVCGAGAFAWWRNKQAGERERADEQARSEQQRIETAGRERLEAEQGFKARQARDGIDTSLKLSTDLRKAYKFKAAVDALAQAEKLAESGAPERLAELRQARADLAFVEHLDDIRYRKWGWTAVQRDNVTIYELIARPEYRQAFADYGLDLAAIDLDEAVKRIAASAVKTDLVAAVDDWALSEPDDTLRNRLLETARKADPGEWTDRLRDPAVQSDVMAVAQLAVDADLRGAVAAYHEAVKHAPDFALAHNELARMFATGPDHVRDGKRAVEHATRACELTAWKDSSFVGTLGAAHAEVGDFDKAAEYQKKALSFADYFEKFGAGGRQRLALFAQRKPYYDPAFAPREVAPPPHEVKR